MIQSVALSIEAFVLPVCMLAAFVSTSVLVLALTTPIDSPAMRLARYARMTGRRGSPGADAEILSFRERLLSPGLRRLIELAASVTPVRARRSVATELVMAGSQMSPTVLLGLRTILAIGLPLLAVLYVLGKGRIEPMDWALLIMSLVWGQRLTTMWLKRRIRARQRAIDRHVPYAIDLMVACLEGGLSMDAALAKVAEQSEGPLAQEIRRTLHELSLGRPAAEAVRDLGERTGAPGLKHLTEDIVQADRMGISVAESLRQVAHDSRLQRRQHAEELARKAPIKMVPVLIFCVLPALGIVTTAPAAILLMRSLSRSTGLP